MRRTRVAALLMGIALVLPASAGAREVLPFIEDDYGRAAAEARARNVPIFVDAWAPW
jgi:hypothetical protein